MYKKCPFCYTLIDWRATRCSNCTSHQPQITKGLREEAEKQKIWAKERCVEKEIGRLKQEHYNNWQKEEMKRREKGKIWVDTGEYWHGNSNSYRRGGYFEYPEKRPYGTPPESDLRNAAEKRCKGRGHE